MNFIRKIYDWVLSWADKPSGATALCFISFAEASFFPIPPDVLLIPLAIGNRLKAIYFGLICSISSVFGAMFGYAIGLWIWWSGPTEFSGLANFFFDHVPGFNKIAFFNVKELYDQYDFLIIFTAGFTPIPFKLFTISGGAFGIKFPQFIIAAFVGRTLRFMLVTLLLKIYGESIERFINKYFNILTIIFLLLLIGGFFIIKVIL